MPLFRITVKTAKNSNGVRIEKGMSVDVVSNSFNNPVVTNGGQSVIDAFYRIYGIDIKKLVHCLLCTWMLRKLDS